MVEAKMKQVLVRVGGTFGERYGIEMEEAVDELLAEDFCAEMDCTKLGRQLIRRKIDNVIVAECSNVDWLPISAGYCPDEFVLNLSVDLLRADVPDYTGKVKGE